MEKLAKKLATEISKSLAYDDEKEQVIAYGLIAIMQAIVTVILVLLGGFITGAPVEALIICFSISILRKYSGGAHLSSIERCTALGAIYCIMFSSIGKYLLAPKWNMYFMIFTIVAVYFLSFLAIFKLAPVDSPNKLIKSEKKKRRMKKGSMIVLSIYFTLSIIFLLLSSKNHAFNSFSISLLLGIVWQIMTLTKFGSNIIDKIDFLARNIVVLGKEAKQ